MTADIQTPPAICEFRAPAVPLVTHDPYFSVWSFADKLTDDWPRHWTGAINGLCLMARVDGKPYRLCGPQPDKAPAAPQTKCEIWPTRTIYTFQAGSIQIKLTFCSPLLPQHADLASRPVTYLTLDAQATDAASHEVTLYCDASAEWGVNTTDQPVTWSRYRVGNLTVLRVGTQAQPVLEKVGDNLRIDWGYFCLAVPNQPGAADILAGDEACRRGFLKSGKLPDSDDLRMPRPASDEWPVLAVTLDCGKVGAQPVSRHLLFAYDDQFSIEYFYRKLRPYWARKGTPFHDMLHLAEQQYDDVVRKCKAFDEGLIADLAKTGGNEYAAICSLAYRQCLAANKIVADFDGTMLMFPKENFSNGCIGTVDVIYPAAPFFLLFSPEMLKAQLKPVLDYAQSARWPHPFAPHDLGTYPKANGQVYGGGEKTEENQMPVEESGNMLLMLAALCHLEGHADFAKPYFATLTKWAEYLRDKGLDPDNQLCTDDFAGHLAHNANLSLKAILALGGYGQICEKLGKTADAKQYAGLAQEMAEQWSKLAADGDHYKLAFDKPGTWSQKYNLVWDKILNLNLFPADIAKTEIAYYISMLNEFGLPLDNRQPYTKTDWTLWTATLADNGPDFQKLIAPVYKFITETLDRAPFTDWYWTQNGKLVGFRARSVIGGVYIKLLAEPAIWKKWATHK